jgi:hypothetical protein
MRCLAVQLQGISCGDCPCVIVRKGNPTKQSHYAFEKRIGLTEDCIIPLAMTHNF